MSEFMPSRREAIRSLGGAFVASAFGLGTPVGLDKTAANEDNGGGMLVDSHVHIVSSRISRVLGTPASRAPFDMLDEPGGAERLAKLIEGQMKAADIGHALCMPSVIEVSEKDPLGIHSTLAQAALIYGPKLHPVGIAHPERFDEAHLDRVEAVLAEGRVKALKAYLGYLHYEPSCAGYRPYYRLAAKYGIPVILHTGDTNSPTAKVKYAHPLLVDEIAVDFPETRFVLAHFGNPWVLDAAQVVYKNKNVWVDLSAFLIGDAGAFAEMEKQGVLKRAVTRVKEGIEYAEAPDRFLFGSDWPLAPIAVYRDFVGQLFPKEQHEAVFRNNAKALFAL